MGKVAVVLVGLCALAAPCRGGPVLRIATLAPDGTVWARELHEWEALVEKESGGAVRVKIYFGGVAGDELEVGERIRRGQLDGILSAGTMCERAAPSLRVMKVLGMFQSRDEAALVMRRLKPVFDREAQANGFVNIAEGGLGSVIIFSRKPVASMTELRRTTFWTGRQDELTRTQLSALGVHVVPLALTEAGPAYAAGRVDGFLTPPSVALSWQWSKQTPYFSDLHLSFLYSCLLVSNASFDEPSPDAQAAVRTAVAQLLARSEKVGRQLDDELVNRLFEKQGLKHVRVDERFRTEFFEAARGARERIGESLLSAELIRQVLQILADYRGEHR